MLIRHALGSRPPEVHYQWAPLWQLDEVQKATVAKTKADTTKVYFDTGLIPADALAKVTVNQLVEDGTYPGLEAAIDESPEELGAQPAEGDLAAAGSRNGNVIPLRRQPQADAAPRTLYVSRKVLNAGAIIAWAKIQGFKTALPATDLHVTIAFSRAPVDWMKVGESWASELRISAGGPRLMERFGDATVLLFTAAELRWRHDDIKAAGASWDFPEYQPHITISYEDARPLEEIEPYQGEIVLGPEIFAEVDEDWQSKVAEDGGGRQADRPFVEDARKRRRKKNAPRARGYDPNQPRGTGGRWIETGRKNDRPDKRKIRNLVSKTFSQRGEKRSTTLRLDLGPASNAQKIKVTTGVDVGGYRRVIDSGDVRKAMKAHPELTRRDFEKVPQIVRNASVIGGGHRGGIKPPTLTYRAKIGAFEYYYAETIRRGTKHLALKTLAKRRI